MTFQAIVKRLTSQAAAALVVTWIMANQTAGFEALSFEGNNPTINLSVEGTLRFGTSSNTPSGPLYDPRTKRIFVGSEDRLAIDVINVSTPSSPQSLPGIGLGEEPGSMAFSSEGILAVSYSDFVHFYNANGDELINAISMPGAGDLEFTPDGQKLVTSGEDDNDERTINILDLDSPNWEACRQGAQGCTINTTSSVLNFNIYNSRLQQLLGAGVRLPFPNLSVAQNMNAKDLTISEDSSTAWLTTGDNNAIVEIDLQTPGFNKIFGLGTKDNSISISPFQDTTNSLPGSLLPGGGIRSNGLDASDRDGAINIRTWPIKSFYNPDDLGSYTSGGQTYLVTSNEGDADDDTKTRLKDLTLHESNPAFGYQNDQDLGRVLVSTVEGDDDGDGIFEKTFGYGGRSFSIWSTDGSLLFESGDDFEQITAAALPDHFNASSGSNAFDNRSDDRGPEPEAMDIGTIDGRTYAFIGFERISGIMVYDITDPLAVSFQQYINNRNFAEDPESLLSVDVEPEGIFFISADESPLLGVPMIAVSHELSDSTTLYRIDIVPEPSTLLLSISLCCLLAFQSSRRSMD